MSCVRLWNLLQDCWENVNTISEYRYTFVQYRSLPNWLTNYREKFFIRSITTSAAQQIPHLSCKPTLHHWAHNTSELVPLPAKWNEFKNNFFILHFNIIPTSTKMSSCKYHPFRAYLLRQFLHALHIPPITATSPAHPIPFRPVILHRTHNKEWGLKKKKRPKAKIGCVCRYSITHFFVENVTVFTCFTS